MSDLSFIVWSSFKKRVGHPDCWQQGALSFFGFSIVEQPLLLQLRSPNNWHLHWEVCTHFFFFKLLSFWSSLMSHYVFYICDAYSWCDITQMTWFDGSLMECWPEQTVACQPQCIGLDPEHWINILLETDGQTKGCHYLEFLTLFLILIISSFFKNSKTFDFNCSIMVKNNELAGVASRRIWE